MKLVLLYELLERIQIFFYRDRNLGSIPEIRWYFPDAKICIHKITPRKYMPRKEKIFLTKSIILHSTIWEFTIMKNIKYERLSKIFILIGGSISRDKIWNSFPWLLGSLVLPTNTIKDIRRISASYKSINIHIVPKLMSEELQEFSITNNICWEGDGFSLHFSTRFYLMNIEQNCERFVAKTHGCRFQYGFYYFLSWLDSLIGTYWVHDIAASMRRKRGKNKTQDAEWKKKSSKKHTYYSDKNWLIKPMKMSTNPNAAIRRISPTSA